MKGRIHTKCGNHCIALNINRKIDCGTRTIDYKLGFYCPYCNVILLFKKNSEIEIINNPYQEVPITKIAD